MARTLKLLMSGWQQKIASIRRVCCERHRSGKNVCYYLLFKLHFLHHRYANPIAIKDCVKVKLHEELHKIHEASN